MYTRLIIAKKEQKKGGMWDPKTGKKEINFNRCFREMEHSVMRVNYWKKKLHK